jgi:hypothetical protein
MTPEQIAILTSFLALLSKWPVWAGLILTCVIGPWAAMGVYIRIIERNQEKRFTEFLSRYEANIGLVKFSETVSQDYKELALMVNTALTTLVKLIENNLYCPLVRNDRLRDVISKLVNEDRKSGGG